ncbi:hypothetical protein PUN28_004660 [Cardiocondyla obscurior]|uniref:Uncharacterized protein n=1 Tax=Cardiocondyla obscurior TaxID=286306 RepID=A0AAW2GC21_9HYME
MGNVTSVDEARPFRPSDAYKCGEHIERRFESGSSSNGDRRTERDSCCRINWSGFRERIYFVRYSFTSRVDAEQRSDNARQQPRSHDQNVIQ